MNKLKMVLIKITQDLTIFGENLYGFLSGLLYIAGVTTLQFFIYYSLYFIEEQKAFYKLGINYKL